MSFTRATEATLIYYNAQRELHPWVSVEDNVLFVRSVRRND